MQLSVWTYEGPPHVGAMRVATAMEGLHYVLHAPQGDTYADLLFTMIERRGKRPPVTYTTFQARDLGTDTAALFQDAAREAVERFRPQALMVGASCTAELIQDDPGGLAEAARLGVPVIALELPSYQRKENWGAAESFYQVVRTLADQSVRPRGATRKLANILGPTALGFRHRDDVIEVRKILRLARNRSESRRSARSVARTTSRGSARRISTSSFIPRSAANRLAGSRRRSTNPPSARCPSASALRANSFARLQAWRRSILPTALGDSGSRMPWWSRSVDSTYLTGKRVFVFGDATHAIAAARIAKDELGFDVCGLGCYNREFARELREAAARYGVDPLITDDHLVVEDAIAAASPELVLGTQMERHIAKRLGLPCAVISAPVHVQDFPSRHSPQMGFEGANVIFDTWVHPLVMGLEEHLPHHVSRGLRVQRRRGGEPSRRTSNRAHGPGSGPGERDRSNASLLVVDGRGRARTPKDPLLRARKGAAEHGNLCDRARPRGH